jgi:hypothetical protein
MKLPNKINLEGKDNSAFFKSKHGLYMEVFKDKSKPAVFISKAEYIRVNAIKSIMSKQPWYLRLLLKFNQYSFIENLYFKLSV